MFNPIHCSNACKLHIGWSSALACERLSFIFYEQILVLLDFIIQEYETLYSGYETTPTLVCSIIRTLCFLFYSRVFMIFVKPLFQFKQQLLPISVDSLLTNHRIWLKILHSLLFFFHPNSFRVLLSFLSLRNEMMIVAWKSVWFEIFSLQKLYLREGVLRKCIAWTLTMTIKCLHLRHFLMIKETKSLILGATSLFKVMIWFLVAIIFALIWKRTWVIHVMLENWFFFIFQITGLLLFIHLRIYVLRRTIRNLYVIPVYLHVINVNSLHSI